MKYRMLNHNEIIQAGDERDFCRNPWHDEPEWRLAPKKISGLQPRTQNIRHTECIGGLNIEMRTLLLVSAVTLALAAYLAVQDATWEPSFSEIGAAGEWSGRNE